MDKKSGITIKCETEGFDEATEKVETLVDAFNEFPPQVQIKNCHDCNINIYPSQTKFMNKQKARNDMSVEVINGMADTIAELEQKIEFICEQIAKDFGEPCNFSPMDEIMLSIGRCGEDCGDVPASECWKRYFEEMQRRAEQ